MNARTFLDQLLLLNISKAKYLNPSDFDWIFLQDYDQSFSTFWEIFLKHISQKNTLTTDEIEKFQNLEKTQLVQSANYIEKSKMFMASFDTTSVETTDFSKVIQDILQLNGINFTESQNIKNEVKIKKYKMTCQNLETNKSILRSQKFEVHSQIKGRKEHIKQLIKQLNQEKERNHRTCVKNTKSLDQLNNQIYDIQDKFTSLNRSKQQNLFFCQQSSSQLFNVEKNLNKTLISCIYSNSPDNLCEAVSSLQSEQNGYDQKSNSTVISYDNSAYRPPKVSLISNTQHCQNTSTTDSVINTHDQNSNFNTIILKENNVNSVNYLPLKVNDLQKENSKRLLRLTSLLEHEEVEKYKNEIRIAVSNAVIKCGSDLLERLRIDKFGSIDRIEFENACALEKCSSLEQEVNIIKSHLHNKILSAAQSSRYNFLTSDYSNFLDEQKSTLKLCEKIDEFLNKQALRLHLIRMFYTLEKMQMNKAAHIIFEFNDFVKKESVALSSRMKYISEMAGKKPRVKLDENLKSLQVSMPQITKKISDVDSRLLNILVELNSSKRVLEGLISKPLTMPGNLLLTNFSNETARNFLNFEENFVELKRHIAAVIKDYETKKEMLKNAEIKTNMLKWLK